MQDKRTYPRVDVVIPALITEDRNHEEIPCTVRNISENGICFEFNSDGGKYVDSLQKGDAIHFQFIDTYQFGSNIETDVLSNDCTVRHIRICGDMMIIGGYVTEEEFRQYAARRELVSSIGRFRALA